MHILPSFSKSLRLFQKWKSAKYYTFSLKTCKKVENVNHVYYHSRQKFQSPPCKRVHPIWKIHITLLEYKLYNNTKNKHIFVNMVKMWIWAKSTKKAGYLPHIQEYAQKSPLYIHINITISTSILL